MTANSLLAAAMAGGEDGLSPRDCWLCIAYLYAGGKSAQTQLKNAIADGLDRLSTGDVLKCIAYLLNGGSVAVTVAVSGAGTTAANGVYTLQANGNYTFGSFSIQNRPDIDPSIPWVLFNSIDGLYANASLLGAWGFIIDGQFPNPTVS